MQQELDDDFWRNYATTYASTGASTTSGPATVEEAIQILRDFEAKFPKSELLVRVKLPWSLLKKIPPEDRRPVMPGLPDTFYGVPCELIEDYETPEMHFADGSKKVWSIVFGKWILVPADPTAG